MTCKYFASLIFFREDSPEIMKLHVDTFRLHFDTFWTRVVSNSLYPEVMINKRLVHSQPSALKDVL